MAGRLVILDGSRAHLGVDDLRLGLVVRLDRPHRLTRVAWLHRPYGGGLDRTGLVGPLCGLGRLFRGTLLGLGLPDPLLALEAPAR
ncbi:hypothetical protein GCM10009841_22210 [Microlunatus panaciterrae]